MHADCRLNPQTKTEGRDLDTIRPIIRAIHGTLYSNRTLQCKRWAMAFCTNCVFAAEKDGVLHLNLPCSR